MAVPTTIALYASPPSCVCSTPHACQINGHGSSFDFELSSRSVSSSSTATSAPKQKPVIGGLSGLFSSKHGAISGEREESGCLRHENNRCDELKELSMSSSFCHPPSPFGSFLKRDQHSSPVSVLQNSIISSSSPSSSLVGGRSAAGGTPQSTRSSSVYGSLRGGATGFGRNVLGSCVDYDSPSSRVHNGSSDIAFDELTFAMDDSFSLEVKENKDYAKDILLNAQSRHVIFCDDFVVKAFYEAEKAHRGQMRANGDPYLQHCVETAVLLAIMGANSMVVAAGLLHDTLDDSFLSYNYILRTFGAGVADLVEGVSKLSHLSKLARDNDTAAKIEEADRLHTMFLAMADARAVLIKLADRLHNMMTLGALPLLKQQRFAKETLEIFVPLANRLGVSSWKEELENLCFKHLYPDQQESLSSRFMESFNEEMITSAVEKLEHTLMGEGVCYHVVSGRHKSLYSIYRKMLKKKLNMDEIHDIHGIRLIVETKEDCYKALRVVRGLWSEVPGKFKDYISQPKFNGYQSLHTVVQTESTAPLEVQIRTKQMHLQAEFGFAAHWRYKEGECKHSSYVLQMVKWARWVLSWHCEAMSKDLFSCFGHGDSIKLLCSFPTHSNDCPFSYKSCLDHDGPVFVIAVENDKMSVQEFPANSTIGDLLERSGRGTLFSKWSALKESLRPKLNHEPVGDPTVKLKMGDVVELTPPIPDKSLTKYREEIRRMYDQGLVSVLVDECVGGRRI